MASKASLFLVLVISMLLFTNSVMPTEEETEPESTYPPPPPPPHRPIIVGPIRKPYQFCVEKCEARCKTHKRIRPCMKPCTHCCKRSNQCVPPGTSGNQQMCSNWTSIVIHGVPTQCP